MLGEAEMYTGLYGRPGAAQGWHFLTGDEPQIKPLAQAVGFRYAYDSASRPIRASQRHHDADARGKMSRYFYGINIPRAICGWAWWRRPKEKSELPSIRFCCYCYHYDPSTGKYGLLISHVVKCRRSIDGADPGSSDYHFVPAREIRAAGKTGVKRAISLTISAKEFVTRIMTDTSYRVFIAQRPRFLPLRPADRPHCRGRGPSLFLS